MKKISPIRDAETIALQQIDLEFNLEDGVRWALALQQCQRRQSLPVTESTDAFGPAQKTGINRYTVRRHFLVSEFLCSEQQLPQEEVTSD
jgi:hypothetical protein